MGQIKLGAFGAILSLMLVGCAALPPAEAARRTDSVATSPLSAPLCRLGFASIPMTALPSGHHIGQDVMRDQKAVIDVEHSVLYLKTVDQPNADTAPCDEDAAPAETAIAQAGDRAIPDAARSGSW